MTCPGLSSSVLVLCCMLYHAVSCIRPQTGYRPAVPTFLTWICAFRALLLTVIFNLSKPLEIL